MQTFAASVGGDDAIRPFRGSLRGWLESEGIPEPPLEAVVLATHEAVVNALQHAGSADPVEVRATRDDGHVVVEVVDHGTWRQPVAPWNEERGRGLQLMRGLVSGVEVLSDPAGTTVRLRERFTG